MSDDPKVRQHFEQFAEVGEKHAFRLRSGQDFLGWVGRCQGRCDIGYVGTLPVLRSGDWYE